MMGLFTFIWERMFAPFIAEFWRNLILLLLCYLIVALMMEIAALKSAVMLLTDIMRTN